MLNNNNVLFDSNNVGHDLGCTFLFAEPEIWTPPESELHRNSQDSGRNKQPTCKSYVELVYLLCVGSAGIWNQTNVAAKKGYQNQNYTETARFLSECAT